MAKKCKVVKWEREAQRLQLAEFRGAFAARSQASIQSSLPQPLRALWSPTSLYAPV